MRLDSKRSLLRCDECKQVRVYDITMMRLQCPDGHCWGCGRKQSNPCATCRQYMRSCNTRNEWQDLYEH